MHSSNIWEHCSNSDPIQAFHTKERSACASASLSKLAVSKIGRWECEQKSQCSVMASRQIPKRRGLNYCLFLIAQTKNRFLTHTRAGSFIVSNFFDAYIKPFRLHLRPIYACNSSLWCASLPCASSLESKFEKARKTYDGQTLKNSDLCFCTEIFRNSPSDEFRRNRIWFSCFCFHLFSHHS